MQYIARLGSTAALGASKYSSRLMGVSTSSSGRFSTVAANTIHIQFVDAEGNRARLPGRVGQSLLEVAEQHSIALEGPCHGGGAPTELRRSEEWVEDTWGEGLSCFLCHVQIPSTFNHVLPEQTQEMKDGLEDVWEDEANVSSRLACTITLTKDMNDMVVYVPDVPPIDCM
jgi:ferredoxin